MRSLQLEGRSWGPKPSDTKEKRVADVDVCCCPFKNAGGKSGAM